jgi:hypothetical protein
LYWNNILLLFFVSFIFIMLLPSLATNYNN